MDSSSYSGLKHIMAGVKGRALHFSHTPDQTLKLWTGHGILFLFGFYMTWLLQREKLKSLDAIDFHSWICTLDRFVRFDRLVWGQGLSSQVCFHIELLLQHDSVAQFLIFLLCADVLVFFFLMVNNLTWAILFGWTSLSLGGNICKTWSVSLIWNAFGHVCWHRTN